MNNHDIEAMHERERKLPSAVADPDIQEALSLRYSDQVVILLRLKSGNFAVYNNLRELCGIATQMQLFEGVFPPSCWHPPPPPAIRREAKVAIDLEELGLV